MSEVHLNFLRLRIDFLQNSFEEPGTIVRHEVAIAMQLVFRKLDVSSHTENELFQAACESVLHDGVRARVLSDTL